MALKTVAVDSDDALHLKSSFAQSQGFEYTYNIPALPRVIIPPIIPGSDGSRHSLRSIEDSCGRNNLSFLKKIDLNSDCGQAKHCVWEYSRRREAQMILPYLYLGPISAARDMEFLKREHITMLLAIRYTHGQQSKLMASTAQAASNLRITYEEIDVQSPHFVGSFSKSVDMINQHMSSIGSASMSPDDTQGIIGKVLVFCGSGNDVSAAVVAAYLMNMLEGVDHIKAMQLCQAQRFSAHFNDAMKTALQSYWDILCARRDVLKSSIHHTESVIQAHGLSREQLPVQSLKGKRALDDNNQNEDEMDCSSDIADSARFEGRSAQPFHEVIDS